MDTRKLISNLSVAFFSQIVTLCLSFITALLVPKVLGVDQFGYWQLFLFYASYAGLFHLGLNDGVYLIHGGEDRNSIDKREVGAQFYIGLVFQICIASCIAVYAVIFCDGASRDFVLLMTAIYLIVHNAASYLGYLFQAMNETKLFSYSTIINKLAFCVPLTILIVIRCTDFRLYVIAYLFGQTISLAVCVIWARDFLIEGYPSICKAFPAYFISIKVGIKLMIANIASTLIIGVVRFFIDFQWGIETFGQLSFSLSLVNFFLAFITQVSMVLFPALRSAKKHELRSFFDKSREALGIVLPVSYLLYFPATWFLSVWLPQYAESFRYFALLLPICVFDGKMNIIGTTYLKVLRREKSLLIINIIAMISSLVLSYVSIFALGSIWLAFAGVVVVIASRSLIVETILSKELSNGNMRMGIEEAVLTIVFVTLTHWSSGLLVFIAIAVCYCVFLACNKSAISALAKTFRSKVVNR